MNSITVSQAALLAAIAMVLLAGFSLADNRVLLESDHALVLLGTTVPFVVWAGFFLTVYRRPGSIKIAAWVALAFALLLDAIVAYLRFQQSINYWTPFGNAISLPGLLLRLGWGALLLAFAICPEHQRTRQIALVVAILSAPSAFGNAYDLWNNAIGFLLGDMPSEALWRALITPGIRAVYGLSQILFLWTVWKSPLAQSGARLAS